MLAMKQVICFYLIVFIPFLALAQDFKSSKITIFLGNSDTEYFASFEVMNGTYSIKEPMSFTDLNGNVYEVKIKKMTKKVLNLDTYTENEVEVQQIQKGDKIMMDFETIPAKTKVGEGYLAKAGTAVKIEKPKIIENAFAKLNGVALVDGHDTNHNAIVPPNMPLFDNPNGQAFQITLFFALKDKPDLGGQLLIHGDFNGKTGVASKLEVVFTGTTIAGKKSNNFYNGTKQNPSDFKLSFTKLEKQGNQYIASGNFSGTLKPFLAKLMTEFDGSALNFSEGRFENIKMPIYSESDKKNMENMFPILKN